MYLAEASSKCDHIASVPLQAGTAAELNRLYMAKGVRATTAIEGNTLSEPDVARRIQGELDLPKSQDYLGQEVDNVAAALNETLHRAEEYERLPIDADRIKEINLQILAELEDHLEDWVVPGQFRTRSVTAGRYVAPPAEDCDYLVERLCSWLGESAWQEDMYHPLVLPILKAITAHLYLVSIHPFGDGNGRTSRLLEFQILVMAGTPQPAAHLLSNHYNLTRAEYYRQLDRFSSSTDIIPFVMYALEGFVDGLRSQLEHIRQQQFQVAWESVVHESITGSSEAAGRQRSLVFALTDQPGDVQVSDIRNITAQLASAYARKTSKTITRDINHLIELGLVARVARGRVRVKKEILLNFLPKAVGKVTDREGGSDPPFTSTATGTQTQI